MSILILGGERHILSTELTWPEEGRPRLASLSMVDIGRMPSFLAFSQRQNFALAVVEGDDALVSLFVDERGAFKVISRVACGGGPAHVTLDPSERWALTASYGSGETRVFPVSRDFTLSEASQTLVTGKYSHATAIAPNCTSVLVPSKGSDSIALFQLGDESPREDARVQVAPGCGPRHLAFAPDGNRAYLVGENDCSLTTFDWKGGQLLEISHQTTLPNAKTTDDSGADIHVSDDGRFVYVSNRGHDSIAVFEATADGARLVGHQDAHCHIPRNFCLLGDRKLVVAGQESSSLAFFGRDPSTGLLTYLGAEQFGERIFWVGTPDSR